MTIDGSKVTACILGGALGDALGAPLEAMRDLDAVIAAYGPNGPDGFVDYAAPWGDAVMTVNGATKGLITDDTTMLACTLAGIVQTMQEKGDPDPDAVLQMQWQYYLEWGRHQKNGETLWRYITPALSVPDYLQPFLFRCGAGRGTIAALLEGEAGEPDAPILYDRILDGRRVRAPNAGCGAMMRIAPIAFLQERCDILQLARRNAAMTHGHPDAINAAAAVALLTGDALGGDATDFADVLHRTERAVASLPDTKNLCDAWTAARQAYADNKADITTMDTLGYRFGRNAFLALPVFSQTLYALYAAADMQSRGTRDVKSVLRLAVTHSGDSDSVGAIVGNVLGAAWGHEALPRDWIDVLPHKEALCRLGTVWTNTMNAVKP